MRRTWSGGHQQITAAHHDGATQLLAYAERFDEFLAGRGTVLRLGYSWAGLGVHNRPLVRKWEAAHPHAALQLVRYDSPSHQGRLASPRAAGVVAESAAGHASRTGICVVRVIARRMGENRGATLQ